MDAQTAQFGYIPLALGITAKYDLGIHQMDICSPFLGVDLENEICMRPLQ